MSVKPPEYHAGDHVVVPAAAYSGEVVCSNVDAGGQWRYELQSANLGRMRHVPEDSIRPAPPQEHGDG